MDLDPGACYRALELRDSRFDGRFFTAVKTIGVYRRPVCPARTPRFENIAVYPTRPPSHRHSPYAASARPP